MLSSTQFLLVAAGGVMIIGSALIVGEWIVNDTRAPFRLALSCIAFAVVVMLIFGVAR